MADLRQAANQAPQQSAARSGTRSGPGRMARVTTDLPSDQHRAFKIVAMDMNTSMGELLRAAAEAIAAGDARETIAKYIQ